MRWHDDEDWSSVGLMMDGSLGLGIGGGFGFSLGGGGIGLMF